MEPLNPKIRKAILDSNLDASPEDIAEYERLLVQQFAVDPNVLPAEIERREEHLQRQARLSELHQKLFPGRYK